MADFMTPPDHTGFSAKRLYGEAGEIKDVAVAYIQPGGGGPVTPHTHPHGHLFTVTEGRAEIRFEDTSVYISKDESFFVDGTRLHSVWNASDGVTVMIGITVKPKD